jgi:hypothetical protein
MQETPARQHTFVSLANGQLTIFDELKREGQLEDDLQRTNRAPAELEDLDGGDLLARDQAIGPR